MGKKKNSKTKYRNLVTGGAGFVGSQIAHRLLQNGEEVVIVDNFSYGKEDNLEFDDMNLRAFCSIVEKDVSSFEDMKNIFEEFGPFDYVYNIAGIAPLPDCQTNPARAVEVNVNGLVNILECSRRYGVKKVIQASTNAMYENINVFPTEEGSMNGNDSLPTLIYPNTKYCAERFAESYCRTYGMHVACLRFANVYGPHIDCLRTMPPFVGYMIRELYYDRTPVFHSTGKQSRDYIYVDDLVRLALMCRFQDNGFEPINCSSGKHYSVNDLYDMAKHIMNKNISAAYASESDYWKHYPDLYQGAYSINNDILIHEVNKHSECDNTKARKSYGWSPEVDITEGLRRVIEYETKLFAKQDED